MLLDSNLIIYASLPQYSALREFISKHAPAVSVVSFVEVLGYHRLSDLERHVFEQFFESATLLPITDAVILQAVSLRQRYRLQLGDALIGATALVHDTTLLTHNVADFSRIDGLSILDPIA